MSAPSYPRYHVPSQENASCSIIKCSMKSSHDYWSIFSRRTKYKFSASEGFFGVFIPLLKIAVLAKSVNSGVKSRCNSLTKETNSSISSLFILSTQSCLSYKCGNWYKQLGRQVGKMLLLDTVWVFQSSLTEFSSSLMISIKLK